MNAAHGEFPHFACPAINSLKQPLRYSMPSVRAELAFAGRYDLAGCPLAAPIRIIDNDGFRHIGNGPNRLMTSSSNQLVRWKLIDASE